MVGLTFQQIQKYEHGSNRISSSRLYEFAKVLDVPVSYFFGEMPSNALLGRPMSGRGRKGFGEAGTPFEQEKDPLMKPETLELVRAYYKIREGRVRKRIFEMVKAVGAASHAEVLERPKNVQVDAVSQDQARMRTCGVCNGVGSYYPIDEGPLHECEICNGSGLLKVKVLRKRPARGRPRGAEKLCQAMAASRKRPTPSS